MNWLFVQLTGQDSLRKNGDFYGKVWLYLLRSLLVLGVVFMFDIALILIIASVGGVIAITGFLVILGRRILEPKKELQQKIDKLEEEVKILKNHK